METHIFRRVLGDLSETLRKLCFSTKFPHQPIKWNNGILRSVKAKADYKKKRRQSNIASAC